MLRLPDGTTVLSATDLTGRLACEHLFEQRRAIAHGERGRPRPADDPHGELVKRRGDEHEREQLARLTREAGGCADLSQGDLPVTREALEEGARRTREAIAAGAPLVFQAHLFDGRWQGRADFLRRTPQGGYEVIDTKLARSVKPHVVHQLVLYSRLLADVQGSEPERAHVLLGDGVEHAVELHRYRALHRRVTAEAERIALAGARATYPEPVAHCGICALSAECDARRRADDHLSLVAGIRRPRARGVRAAARAGRAAGGGGWLFAREEHRGALRLLFVDEAGQFPLAGAVAVAPAADGLVLLGDPQQLSQVTKAAHPGASGASVLEHLLAGAATVPPGRGVFLPESWRMHPDVCAFVSERSYDGRLQSRGACAARRVDAPGALDGAGLRFVAAEHEGCSQRSVAEAEAIAAACRELLDGGTVTDEHGTTRRLRPGDLMVVAPYNLAVLCIRAHVPEGVQVGTVDRFQGREAPVVFFAMTCSTGEDVPRGLDFLFSRNRLNVAVSRAQCLAVLVANPRLLHADCRTLEAMELVDGACRFVELATAVKPGGRPLVAA